MKIGILTWHSQLNYGGVLQCWALQTVLERMGHEVVIIDRWLDKRNESLLGEYSRWGGRQWIRYLFRGILGCGDLGLHTRHINTKRFIYNCLHRTGYHFLEWQNAPKDLGIDLLVVGSDQLWHCNPWTRHDIYLLENAPKIPAIAYAASFGRPDIPPEFMEQYRCGFARFSAISVRERQAVSLVESCGGTATHVADPTILVSPADVFTKFGKPVCSAKKTILCYFLSQSVFEVLPELRKFAQKKRCFIRVYVDVLSNKSLLPTPHGFRQIVKRFVSTLVRCLDRVKIVRDAGPQEFVEGLAKAEAVITDSFHGLMFSAIYGKNVRMLRPRNEFRKLIFGRIEEFVEKFTVGACISDSVSSALDSVEKETPTRFDSQAINSFRSESRSWLSDAIEKIHV